MLTLFKKDKKAIIVCILFAVLLVWWLFLKFQHESNPDSLNLFAGVYGIIALLGGIWGWQISKKWGGTKAIIGRAIIMFSIGLLAQEFGQLVYAYYAIVSKIEVPYPSLGDLGYFGSIPLYIYGTILFAQASGIKISLKALKNKIQAFVIPLVLLITSYFVLLRAYEYDWHRPLTVFLDFGYPFGQAIYISIAILAYLLSRKLLGGIMRGKILFILFALLAQYIADFNFLYQNSRETWTTAGYGDFLYVISYLLMTLSLINFGTAIFTDNTNSQKAALAEVPSGSDQAAVPDSQLTPTTAKQSLSDEQVESPSEATTSSVPTPPVEPHEETDGEGTDPNNG